LPWGRPRKWAVTNAPDIRLRGAVLRRCGAFGTVLAKREQPVTGSHGSCSTLIVEAQAMTDARQPEVLRHQLLDSLAVKFAGGIPEQAPHSLFRPAPEGPPRAHLANASKISEESLSRWPSASWGSSSDIGLPS